MKRKSGWEWVILIFNSVRWGVCHGPLIFWCVIGWGNASSEIGDICFVEVWKTGSESESYNGVIALEGGRIGIWRHCGWEAIETVFEVLRIFVRVIMIECNILGKWLVRKVVEATRSLVNTRSYWLECARILHKGLCEPGLTNWSEAVVWREKEGYMIRTEQKENLTSIFNKEK